MERRYAPHCLLPSFVLSKTINSTTSIPTSILSPQTLFSILLDIDSMASRRITTARIKRLTPHRLCILLCGMRYIMLCIQCVCAQVCIYQSVFQLEEEIALIFSLPLVFDKTNKQSTIPTITTITTIKLFLGRWQMFARNGEGNTNAVVNVAFSRVKSYEEHFSNVLRLSLLLWLVLVLMLLADARVDLAGTVLYFFLFLFQPLLAPRQICIFHSVKQRHQCRCFSSAAVTVPEEQSFVVVVTAVAVATQCYGSIRNIRKLPWPET